MTQIYNGLSETAQWDCIGYRLSRLPDYYERAKRLPELASTGSRNKPGRIGRNTVTFTAVPTKTERRSFFYSDATALADVLAIWSFVSGLTVMESHSDRWPTRDDLTFRLASPFDTATSVSAGCKKTVLRPPKQGVRAAMLVYLELPHVHTVEVKSSLVATVLECLAPISAPSQATEGERYRPIIRKLQTLAIVPDNASAQQVEDLIVGLYKIRNGFAHSGTDGSLADTLIPVGPIQAEPRRVVNSCRHICKLAIAKEIGVSITTAAAKNCMRALWNFFDNGTFVPSGFTTHGSSRTRTPHGHAEA